MKVLVVGFGSIGARHCSILQELGHDVYVVTQQRVTVFPVFERIEKALESESIEYVVIANKTSDHYDILLQLVKKGFQGKILVEKPVFEHFAKETSEFINLKLYVGYNLRFHPLIYKLKDLLQKQSIISTAIYFGQYLPNWRPNRDYRASYSSKKSEGGGVLRDLSHEMDYLLWIFGDWQRLTALGGHLSELEVDTEDVVSAMLETRRCPILNLHINYLDRPARREIIVNTKSQTVTVDLIRGTLQTNGTITHHQVERNYTYKEQHLAILNGKITRLCTLNQGMAVLKMIEGIEITMNSKERKWISQ
jgi:predicted dehydrogenase